MPNIRNQNSRIVENDVRHYKELVQRRGVKKIRHYSTPLLAHPTINDRASIPTDSYAWSYGDRFYKLAHDYYGDTRFWWVIAWWNGYPTEVSVQTGDLLQIPLDLNAAIQALGV